MILEGSGCCLVQGSIPVFAWGDWGNSFKASLYIASIPADIWTSCIPDAYHRVTVGASLLSVDMEESVVHSIFSDLHENLASDMELGLNTFLFQHECAIVNMYYCCIQVDCMFKKGL